MDYTARFNRALGARFDRAPTQVWPALVQSVEGVTCTVTLSGAENLTIIGVNLRADEEATDGVLLTPRAGSLVYVGMVNNSLDDLYVCAVSEVDAVDLVIGTTKVQANKDGVTVRRGKVGFVADNDGVALTDGQANVQLTKGKVVVSNASTSLASLFSDLIDLLTAFKVITPVQGAPTPSVSLDPGTTAKVTQLSAKINQLLQ